MPSGLNKFDLKFQDLVGTSEASLSGRTLLMKDASGKNLKVVLTRDGESNLKRIEELKGASQFELERIFKNPDTFFGYSPRLPLNDHFSSQVSHLIFGPGKKDSDGSSGTEWSDGFEGNSVFVRTALGKSFKITIDPTPELYESFKNALTKAETNSHMQAVLLAGGNPHLLISGQTEPFTFSEVKQVCKRIESVNEPSVTSEEAVEKARQTLRLAESQGEVVVQWTNEMSDEIKIPVESLRAAISDRVTEVNNNKRATLGAEIDEEDVADPSQYSGLWDWKKPQIDRELVNPPNFRSDISLKEHQVIGASWLNYLSSNGPKDKFGKRGALVADDMGVGKTIQVLTLLACHLEEIRNGKAVLIVGPSGLLDTAWIKDGFQNFFDPGSLAVMRTDNDIPVVVKYDQCPFAVDKKLLNFEARKWAAEIDEKNLSLSDCSISGELKSQIEQVIEWAKGKIILCSYETLRINSLILGSINFRFVILDEAQRIKNSGALQSHAARSLKSEMNIAMTGTPIENSIMDLWSIVNFVHADKIGGKANFRKRFQIPLKDLAAGSPERLNLRNQLETDLSPLWIRRTKDEVQGGDFSLPPVHYYDSAQTPEGIINRHEIEMSEIQLEIYKDKAAYHQQVQGAAKFEAIQNMLQICLAPWIHTGLEPLWANHKELFQLCPKLRILIELLELIRSGKDGDGRKVLLFVNLLDVQASLRNFIQDWHRSVCGSDIEVQLYNGEVPISMRENILNKFEVKPGFQILILSPRAGGVGLNLQVANHIVHYTREWNPAVERQATCRAYRFKQKRPVHVYYPTTTLKAHGLVCAEEHLAKILRDKRDIIDDFTLSSGDLTTTEAHFEGIKSSVNAPDPLVKISDIASLDDKQFESLIAVIMEREGYAVTLVGGAKDHGVDVVAIGKNENFLLQCKHTSKENIQGNDGVNEVRGADSVYADKFKCHFKLLAVTNFRFSESTHTLARRGNQKVGIWEAIHVEELLHKHSIRLSEVILKLTTKNGKDRAS